MSDMHITLSPDVLFTIGEFGVTNSMLVSWTITILLLVVFGVMAKRMKQIPGKFQLILELFVKGMYDFVHGITKNEKLTDRLFPLFGAMGLFFLAANLVGFIPGLAALTYNDLPLYRAATTDYSMIFVVTLIMFFVIQLTAIFSGGLLAYIGRFLNFKSPIKFFLGIMDIVGELATIVSLSFRLFGNIIAGEVIAIVLLSLMPYVAPVPFMLLGLISSVIQAFIFPILVITFISMNAAVKEELEKEDSTLQTQTA